MRRLLHNIRFYLKARLNPYGYWLSLQSRWLTWEREQLFFLAALATVLLVISLLITFSVIDKADNKQLNCLALNIYHEARGEPRTGQFAVAEVTMNRVMSRHYPDTICKVVYEKHWDKKRKRYVGAFSWTELERKENRSSPAWTVSVNIATTVYKKRHTPRLKGALFYHANYVKPFWARNKKPVAIIGQHLFYR